MVHGGSALGGKCFPRTHTSDTRQSLCSIDWGYLFRGTTHPSPTRGHFLDSNRMMALKLIKLFEEKAMAPNLTLGEAGVSLHPKYDSSGYRVSFNGLTGPLWNNLMWLTPPLNPPPVTIIERRPAAPHCPRRPSSAVRGTASYPRKYCTHSPLSPNLAGRPDVGSLFPGSEAKRTPDKPTLRPLIQQPQW